MDRDFSQRWPEMVFVLGPETLYALDRDRTSSSAYGSYLDQRKYINTTM